MSNVITGIDLYIDAINRCNCQGGGEHQPSNHLTFDAIDQSNPQDITYTETYGWFVGSAIRLDVS